MAAPPGGPPAANPTSQYAPPTVFNPTGQPTAAPLNQPTAFPPQSTPYNPNNPHPAPYPAGQQYPPQGPYPGQPGFPPSQVPPQGPFPGAQQVLPTNPPAFNPSAPVSSPAPVRAPPVPANSPNVGPLSPLPGQSSYPDYDLCLDSTGNRWYRHKVTQGVTKHPLHSGWVQVAAPVMWVSNKGNFRFQEDQPVSVSTSEWEPLRMNVPGQPPMTIYKHRVTGQTSTTPPPEPLPPGWQIARTPDGKTKYFNMQTSQLQDNPPVVPSDETWKKVEIPEFWFNADHGAKSWQRPNF